MNLKEGLLLDNGIEIKWNCSYGNVLELLSSFSLTKEENNKHNYKSICINAKTLGLEKILRIKFSFVNNQLVSINFSKCEHFAYNLEEIMNDLIVIFGKPNFTSSKKIGWYFGKVVLQYRKIQIDDYFNEYLEININNK